VFDQETEIIIKSVLQRTIANQPAIAVKDILAADIPYPLKTFLRADVEFLLLDEFQQYHKTSRFNFEHPEVRSLQLQMNSVLVLHFSFERLDYLRRIDDTVHLVINYLIRPQWTLLNVMFEKEPSIPTSTLLRMLKYFGPYEYLRDIITRYSQEKHVTAFTKRDFSTFLWKVDGEYVRRKAGDELARIMSPIYEFLDFPRNTGSKTLPVKGLMKFFKDKGMTSVMHRLEGELMQGKTDLSRRELGEMLEDIRRTSGAFDVEPVDDRLPKEEMLQARMLTATNAGFGEPRPGSPAPDRRLITIDDGDRKKIIRKIFLNEEQKFTTAIATLQSLTTWKQASTFIDEIFIRNDVDPYCSEAERFIKVMYQQYHLKG
jgi:hypothetical protein